MPGMKLQGGVGCSGKLGREILGFPVTTGDGAIKFDHDDGDWTQ